MNFRVTILIFFFGHHPPNHPCKKCWSYWMHLDDIILLSHEIIFVIKETKSQILYPFFHFSEAEKTEPYKLTGKTSSNIFFKDFLPFTIRTLLLSSIYHNYFQYKNISHIEKTDLLGQSGEIYSKLNSNKKDVTRQT